MTINLKKVWDKQVLYHAAQTGLSLDHAAAVLKGRIGVSSPLGELGLPTRGKPMQPKYVDLLDAIVQVDPTNLINRKYFTPYNPEALVGKKGMKIFDQMKRDDQVKACLKFKKDAMLSSGWEVVSPGDQDDDWEVTRFVIDQLKAVKGGWRKIMKKLLTALEYGHSVTEKVFTELDEGEWKGKVGLKELISIKPHYLDFVTDVHGRILAVLQRNVAVVEGSDTRKRDPLYPPGKFVIYTHAEEFENPYGNSDLIATYMCYSSDTEALTKQGWKLVSDITKSDEVAVLNDQGVLEYGKPSSIFKYRHQGKMFHQGGRFVDLMVTENHNMWVQLERDYQHGSKNFEFIQAKDLPRHVRYKRDAKWLGKRQEVFELLGLPMDQWLWVLGVWLAEGYVTQDEHYIYICQSNNANRAVIKKRVEEAGLKCHDTGRAVVICNTKLARYLKPYSGSWNKQVPRECLDLLSEQLEILLDGMMFGDGWRGCHYATVSKQLADDVSEIALKIGRAANVMLEQRGKAAVVGGRFSENPIYVVTIHSQSMGASRVNCGKDQREWVDYDGYVYCLEVPYHRLYVRRNGKACWSGNSWWVKHNADKWFSIYLERFGMPPLIALYNYGVYQGNMLDKLKDFLKTIQNSTVGVLPRLSKEDLELWAKEIGSSSKEIFASSIDFYDRRIARSLLVPSLLGVTADEGTGSLARSQTHFDAFILTLRDLQEDVADNAVQEQVIKPLVDLNFPGVEEYPIYRSLPFRDPQLLELFKTWQSLAQGKIVNRVEDDEPFIRRSLGMPENEEPVLEPLPEDAKLDADKEKAKQQAKSSAARKPILPKKLSRKQKKFAEDFDGTWYYVGGGEVCLSNQSDEDEFDSEEVV